MRTTASLSLSLVFVLTACGGDSDDTTLDTSSDDTVADASDGSGADDANTDEADLADDVPAEPCVEGRPLVLAHGFLASGDTWSPHARRLRANGWCANRIVAFDWNTLNRTTDHGAALDETIDRALAATGATQVDLVGHSAGGGLGYTYLSEPERAAKVAHYVHIGSTPQGAPAGPEGGIAIPTLNIWSPDDTVVAGADIEGATNVVLQGADHYAVATSEASFDALFAFVGDGAARDDAEPGPGATVTLVGRALTFGENIAEAGAAIEIWALTDDGTRIEPAMTVTADSDGRWGPVDVAAGAPLELRVAPVREGAAAVHYYREAFAADDALVYLRTLPGPGSLAGALLSSLPVSGPDVILVVFRASQAMLAGVDSLTLDDLEVVREDTAAASKTAIAMFFYDANGNATSDDTTVALFGSFPFLSALDWYLPADEGTTRVTLNGRSVLVRNRAAADGVNVVVFD